MNNNKIKLDMNPAGGQNIIMTDKMLVQYLESKLFELIEDLEEKNSEPAEVILKNMKLDELKNKAKQ
ncbi:hypothetical protein [Senegalia massiliensis]